MAARICSPAASELLALLLLTLLVSLHVAASSAAAAQASSSSSGVSLAVASSAEADWARPTVDVAGDHGRSASFRHKTDVSPRADASGGDSEASVPTATDGGLSSGLSALVIVVAVCGAITVTVAVAVVAGSAWRMYKRSREEPSLDLGDDRSVVSDYAAM